MEGGQLDYMKLVRIMKRGKRGRIIPPKIPHNFTLEIYKSEKLDRSIAGVQRRTFEI